MHECLAHACHSCRYPKCPPFAGNLWLCQQGAYVATLHKVLGTLYIATSLPLQCSAFMYNSAAVDSVCTQLNPTLPVETEDKMIMPHYAATLARICQFGLHMGKQSFYNAMLKHRVFDRSIEAALGVLEVRWAHTFCFSQFDVYQPFACLDDSPPRCLTMVL